jgi:pre-rRNA-processing protein TSR2
LEVGISSYSLLYLIVSILFVLLHWKNMTTPSATQVLFARAVIYTFDVWPALRLAVSEQWGGIESKDKVDFLISHLCDEYSEEKEIGSSSKRATTTSSSSLAASTSSPASSLEAPQTPDADDLAEILEGYFADEFESRLEDDSADMIAARLVQLHKLIYATFPPTQESLAAATAEIDRMQQYSLSVRGKKVEAQRTQGSDESDSEDGEEGDDSEKDDAMEVDTEQRPKPPTGPIVDEDGFTTVVKGKRR